MLEILFFGPVTLRYTVSGVTLVPSIVYRKKGRGAKKKSDLLVNALSGFSQT